MKTIVTITGACVLSAAACAAALDDPGRFSGADGGAPAPTVDAGPAPEAGASCTDVPQSVFVRKCGTAGCHDAPHASSDSLDLVAPNVAARLVGIPAFEGGLLVDPNRPEDSILYRRLLAGGAGETMPPAAPLDDATVACVLSWIRGIAAPGAGDSGAPQPTLDAAEGSTMFSPIRIGAGLAMPFTDHDGSTWATDADFTGGDVDSRTNTIGGTPDGALYRNERWGTTFSYAFSVPNADYVVTLKFAETYDGAQMKGGRVFNVSINDQPALQSFDIFAAAGANAALDKSFPVTVQGGMIVLKFDGVQGAAKVDAIAITAK